MKEITKTPENYARNFRITCYVCLLAGIYLGIRALAFSVTAIRTIADGGLSGPSVSIFIILAALLVPILLILTGLLGLLKHPKAGFVLSVIVIIFSLFSLITNAINNLQMTGDWKVVLGSSIPMIATTALPILFVIYATLTKKYPKE